MCGHEVENANFTRLFRVVFVYFAYKNKSTDLAKWIWSSNKYMWRQHLPCFRNDSLLPKVTSMWDWKLPGLRETGFLPPVLFQLSKHSVQLPCPASFSFCSTSQRMPPLRPVQCTHSPTSLTIQQHNTNTHSPHQADSRGKPLFFCVLFTFV